MFDWGDRLIRLEQKLATQPHEVNQGDWDEAQSLFEAMRLEYSETRDAPIVEWIDRINKIRPDIQRHINRNCDGAAEIEAQQLRDEYPEGLL